MERPESVIYDEKARRMVEEMTMAEARHIAERKAQELECECKDGMFPRAAMTDRRKFLFAAGSARRRARLDVAQAAAKAPPGAVHFSVPDDPTKEQGRAVAADGGYGSRSQFETEVRCAFRQRTRTHPGA